MSFKGQVVRRGFRDRGLFFGLAQLCRVIRRKLVGDYRLVFRLDRSTTPPGPGERFQVDQLHRIDQASMSGDHHDSLVKEYSRTTGNDGDAMLRHGRVLWLYLREGRVSSYMWSTSGEHLDHYFFAVPGEAHVFSHAGTVQEDRGMGLMTDVLSTASGRLLSGGAMQLYIDCSDWNMSSRRAIEKAGYALYGHGVHYRNGSSRWKVKS